MGHAFVHTVIDDHSRVAYAEVHDNETATTATGVLRRAVAWFTTRGVSIRRVLSDNGSPYISHLWRDVCAELGITHTRTRPRRPQTNGKVERLHRTMADEWATRAATPPRASDARLCHDGCTSTTTTDPTPPAGTNHPSPA